MGAAKLFGLVIQQTGCSSGSKLGVTWLPSLEDARQYLETFLAVTTGGTTGTSWGEARDAAEHPARHRAARVPTVHRKLPGPNVNSAEAGEARPVPVRFLSWQFKYRSWCQKHGDCGSRHSVYMRKRFISCLVKRWGFYLPKLGGQGRAVEIWNCTDGLAFSWVCQWLTELLFALEGLLEVKNSGNDFTAIHNSARPSREPQKGKIKLIQGTHNWSCLLFSLAVESCRWNGWMHSWQVEKAGILTQAQALWLSLGQKKMRYLWELSSVADPRGRALVLQGPDSQQRWLLGGPLSMFLQLAGMTCTYVRSLLFSPEDN